MGVWRGGGEGRREKEGGEGRREKEGGERGRRGDEEREGGEGRREKEGGELEVGAYETLWVHVCKLASRGEEL